MEMGQKIIKMWGNERKRLPFLEITIENLIYLGKKVFKTIQSFMKFDVGSVSHIFKWSVI